MADQYKAPFGVYAIGGVVDATAKAAIATDFTNLAALINPAKGVASPHPDFQNIPPATAALLVAEIAALAAVIAAA